MYIYTHNVLRAMSTQRRATMISCRDILLFMPEKESVVCCRRQAPLSGRPRVTSLCHRQNLTSRFSSEEGLKLHIAAQMRFSFTTDTVGCVAKTYIQTEEHGLLHSLLQSLRRLRLQFSLSRDTLS